jgi:tetratricopeptide (TPR) repeat protein
VASTGSKAFGRVKSTFRRTPEAQDPFNQPQQSARSAADAGEHQHAAWQARQSPPQALHAILIQAQSQERAGNVLAAAESYEKAMALDGGNLDVLLGYARLQDRRGNFAEATRLYRLATERHGHEATAFNDLALCLARQGRREEASVAMHEAVRLQPDRKLYRNNYAKILVDLGRIDEALAQLTVAHQPASAHYNLAYLLTQRGDQQSAAARHFGRALELDPTMTDAGRWLEALGAPAPSPEIRNAARPDVQPAGGIETRSAGGTVRPAPAAGSRVEPASASGPPSLESAPYFPPSRY